LWRQLRLEHVDIDEVAVSRFAAGLVANGCPVSMHEEPGSCYIELPDSWEKFLTLVSKNHRKRCRRWERDFFDTGRAVVTVSSTANDCRAVWRDLTSLHDARWRCLGKAGVFDDAAFRAFHERAIPALASTQQCGLRTLLFDGEPVAAEYVLQDESALFAYQSGMSVRGDLKSPGNLSIMAMIRDAIATGRRRVDLLRGAESYKFSWTAQRRPAQTFVIRRPSVTGHVGAWCDATWQTMKRAKKMLPVRTN
jgi:CelD/BcsL family acetyltransferase involved in cellulose biosynthesis